MKGIARTMANKEITNNNWLIKNNIWIALYRQEYDILIEYIKSRFLEKLKSRTS